jgi:type I restriction enzyme, S subunit
MNKGWETKPLGEVAEVFDGPHATPKTVDTGPIFLGIGALQDGVINLGETRHVTEQDFKRWTRRVRPQLNDVVFSYETRLGQAAIIPEGLECCLGRRMGLVRFKKGAVVPRFFLFQYLSPPFRDFLDSKTIRGATVDRISIKYFPSIPISFPAVAEQRRIVGILDEAFEGIATAKVNAETNLRNAHAMFESHLNSIFNQRGKGWLEKHLSELCDIKHGFAFDGAEFSSGVPQGKPLVITPGNFTEDGKLLFNQKNTKRFRGKAPSGLFFDVGDLVVVMTDLSSKMKILGKPAFVEEDNVLHNQRIGRVIFSNDRIEKRLLYYFMMTESFLRNIKRTATGTMVKHTAPKRILSNLIPFPSDRNEQRSIINQLDSLREETQRLESIYQRKLAALELLKKSLLHQAFTGQLRIAS